MVVRSGVWSMGYLVGGLRPNPWTVCVVLLTFDSNLPIWLLLGWYFGPWGAWLVV